MMAKLKANRDGKPHGPSHMDQMWCVLPWRDDYCYMNRSQSYQPTSKDIRRRREIFSPIDSYNGANGACTKAPRLP